MVNALLICLARQPEEFTPSSKEASQADRGADGREDEEIRGIGNGDGGGCERRQEEGGQEEGGQEEAGQEEGGSETLKV